MSELGALLREARESKGLSVPEAAAETHIRRVHIEAIEEGRRQDLPDLVYLRGLVTSYGRFLGLDPAEVRAVFEKEYGRAPQGGRRIDSHQPLSEPLVGPGRVFMTVGLLLLAAIVVAAVVWWYWPVIESWARETLNLGQTDRPAVTAPPVAGTSALALSDPTSTATLEVATIELRTATPSPTSAMPSPTAEPTAVVLPTSAALPLPTPGPTATSEPVRPSPTPTPTTAPGIRVVARITSPAWLRVVTDGEVAHEGTLEAGEVREWYGQQSVLVRTGNAGGTELVVNGEELGTLGGAGEVVEHEWTWDGESVSESAPSD